MELEEPFYLAKTEKATKMLKVYEGMPWETFYAQGTRNNTAVNLCISWYVLYDLHEPEDMVERFEAMLAGKPVEYEKADTEVDKIRLKAKEHQDSLTVDDFTERAEVICDYLWKWGPSGDETRAVDYMMEVL